MVLNEQGRAWGPLYHFITALDLHLDAALTVAEMRWKATGSFCVFVFLRNKQKVKENA